MYNNYAPTFTNAYNFAFIYLLESWSAEPNISHFDHVSILTNESNDVIKHLIKTKKPNQIEVILIILRY